MDEFEVMSKIENLEGQVKDAKSSSNYWSQKHTELSAEMESLHCLIDLLPNSPPRKSDAPDGEEWRAITYSVQNRLAAWIATRLK
jgi:hypothetical protein